MEAEDVAYEIMDYMDSASEEDNNKALTILEQYANQRVIEELKELQVGLPNSFDGTLIFIRINKRIKELKQK